MAEATSYFNNIRKLVEKLPDKVPSKPWFLQNLDALKSMASFMAVKKEFEECAETMEGRMERDKDGAKFEQFLVTARQLQKVVQKLPDAPPEAELPFAGLMLEKHGAKDEAALLANDGLLKSAVDMKTKQAMDQLTKGIELIDEGTHGSHRVGQDSWKRDLPADADLKTVLQTAALSILTMDADLVEAADNKLQQACKVLKRLSFKLVSVSQKEVGSPLTSCNYCRAQPKNQAQHFRIHLLSLVLMQFVSMRPLQMELWPPVRSK